MINANVLLTTFAATSMMTLFSYGVAWLSKQPYKEPFLLALLLNYFHVTDTRTNRVIGWILHYVIGFLFVACFEILRHMEWATVSWTSSLLYGTAIGIIGVVSWHIMFSIAEKKPIMNYMGYYIQLFMAHLVFAFTLVGCHLMY